MKENITTEFSARLRKQIKKQGYTQQTLAAAIGCEQSTISQYVSGTRKPDYEVVRKICGELSVSADYLLGIHDTVSPSAKLQGIVKRTGLSQQTVRMIVTQKTPWVEGEIGLCSEGVPELRKLVDLLCSSQAGVNAVRSIYQYVSKISFAPGQAKNVRGHMVIPIAAIENDEEKTRYITADYMRTFQRDDLLVALKQLQKENTGECTRSEWGTLDGLFHDEEE